MGFLTPTSLAQRALFLFTEGASKEWKIRYAGFPSDEKSGAPQRVATGDLHLGGKGVVARNLLVMAGIASTRSVSSAVEEPGHSRGAGIRGLRGVAARRLPTFGR